MKRIARCSMVLAIVIGALAWTMPDAAGKSTQRPSGTLIFASDRDWGNVPSSQIYTVGTDGSKLTKLTNFPWWAVNPVPYPDGTRILFGGISPEAAFKDHSQAYHAHAIFHAHDLYAMDADGSHVTRFPTGLGTPAWSPDGGTIAGEVKAPCPSPCGFADPNAPNVHHIALMNPDGSGLTEITSGSNLDWHPTWSPDGTRIAFERDFNDGSGNGALDVMHRDGSGLTSLLTGPCCFFDPSWSPDGTRISFWNGSALQVLDLASGRVSTIARNAALGGGEDIRNASWSPDGRWLAVGAEEFSFFGEGLYLVSSDGNTILSVPNGDLGADPTWLPA